MLNIDCMSERGAYTKNIPSHPIVEYHHIPINKNTIVNTTTFDTNQICFRHADSGDVLAVPAPTQPEQLRQGHVRAYRVREPARLHGQVGSDAGAAGEHSQEAQEDVRGGRWWGGGGDGWR